MKYIIALTLLICSTVAFSQIDSVTPPYKKFPTLPPVQLLLGDSATVYKKENFPKKKPVLIMIFSPECSHCQHTAEELVKNKEGIKNFSIVMATLHPIYQMNEFVKTYKLNTLNNVVVGKDVHFILPSFYKLSNLPYLAFYDRKGNLIKTFEGSMTMAAIINTFKNYDK